MLGWKQLGPKWLTNEVYRVLELLEEQHIPSRMPSDNMLFCNLFCPPHPGRRWEIRVRRRDCNRAIALLDREGLLDRARLDIRKSK